MTEGETLIVCPPHLPPREVWSVNPDTIKRFYAPTDDRGFVLPEATIGTILELFDDSYEWPVDHCLQATIPDEHHFHWTKHAYAPEYYHGNTTPSVWRNLPTLKAIVPRQVHNVIHAVTCPPNRPKLCEMEKHLRAYELAKRLFMSAQVAASTREKFRLVGDLHDEVANELLVERFDKQF